ncbi:hypothetical protein [Hydrogenothermus marinus]|uniref:Uncharacterized protein n=1 Tax=Hydrogenothermus marinus TaxID=133270 RepID=A0A3M0BMS7_9AQUI|nr:hypothetical protein [Hydrogenothermus marinus]RMA97836.1 hypothetical protein CLV39_0465 [Hydrogenothermus marinus]
MMKILNDFLNNLEQKYKNIDNLSENQLNSLEKDIEQFYLEHFKEAPIEQIRNNFFHFSRTVKEPVKFLFLTKIVEFIQKVRPSAFPIPLVENLDIESFLITVNHPIFEFLIIEKELLPVFPISELYIVDDETIFELTERLFLKDTIIKNGLFYQGKVLFKLFDYIFNKILYYYPEDFPHKVLKKKGKDFVLNENYIKDVYENILNEFSIRYLKKDLKPKKIEKEYLTVIQDNIENISELQFLIKVAQLEMVFYTIFEDEEEEIFQIEQNNEDGVYNLVYFFGLENINFHLLSIFFDYDLILSNTLQIVKELKNNENLKENLENFVLSILDLPYISKKYQNKDILFEIIKETGFKESLLKELSLNAYFRTFQHEKFLENFEENENFYIDTFIQFELSKLFLEKQTKEETAKNIEKVIGKDESIDELKLNAIKFLIYYLKSDYSKIDEKNMNLFVFNLLFEGKENIENLIPENILAEIILDEILIESKNLAIELIAFYPFEERFYKIAGINFKYEIPKIK